MVKTLTSWDPELGHPRWMANKVEQWQSSDCPEYFKPESGYTPESFNYKYNELGYRCDSFSARGNFRIVVTGCSVTFGTGLPMEETWGYRLIEMVRRDFGLMVPYWNLAQSGKSADFLARSLVLSIDRLRPDLVIALLPHIARQEVDYDGIIGDFGNWSLPNVTSRQDSSALAQAVDLVFSFDQEMYSLIKNLTLMRMTCQAYNCDFVWDCWDTVELPPLPPLVQAHRVGEDYKFRFRPPMARDGCHPGAWAHAEYAAHLYPLIQPLIRARFV